MWFKKHFVVIEEKKYLLALNIHRVYIVFFSPDDLYVCAEMQMWHTIDTFTSMHILDTECHLTTHWNRFSLNCSFCFYFSSHSSLHPLNAFIQLSVCKIVCIVQLLEFAFSLCSWYYILTVAKFDWHSLVVENASKTHHIWFFTTVIPSNFVFKRRSGENQRFTFRKICILFAVFGRKLFSAYHEF